MPPELEDFAPMALEVKVKELPAWEKFEVFHPVGHCAPTVPVVDSRWVLTGIEVDGRAAVHARSAANGVENPDGRKRLFEEEGCVSSRSKSQLSPLSATDKIGTM